jgi:hypothetical protein
MSIGIELCPPIGGVALEQDVAAEAMEVGLHAAPPCLFRDCQSPVDQRQGTVRTPRGGLQLRKHPVKKWRIVLALGHIGLESLSEPACARL